MRANFLVILQTKYDAIIGMSFVRQHRLIIDGAARILTMQGPDGTRSDLTARAAAEAATTSQRYAGYTHDEIFAAAEVVAAQAVPDTAARRYAGYTIDEISAWDEDELARRSAEMSESQVQEVNGGFKESVRIAMLELAGGPATETLEAEWWRRTWRGTRRRRT